MRTSVLLCIDGNPQLIQHRKASLERLGFCVITATSRSAAVALLEGRRVPAVLIDCESESVDYEALALDIKERFPHELIILLATCSDTPERVLWLADDYMMRGEPLQRLVQVIAGARGACEEPASSAA